MAQSAAAAVAARGVGNAAVYGVLGFLALTNEHVAAYGREIVRATVHFLSRPVGMGAGGPGSAPMPPHPSMGALEDKIDKLASSLSKAANGGGAAPTTVGAWVASMRFPLMSFSLLSGCAALALRLLGYSMSDVWWVSKAQFRTTTDALREGVAAVASALARVRSELLEKIGVVDANVDRTREELKADVAGVSRKVSSVSDSLQVIEAKLAGIEGGLRTANRGIFLLCHVVSDQVGSARNVTGNSNGEISRSLYKELVNYTSTEFSVGGIALAARPRLPSPPPPSSSLTQQQQQQQQQSSADPTVDLRQELMGRGILAPTPLSAVGL